MEISNQECEWQEISCLDDSICVRLPYNWERPSDETITKKFPYHTKPQEIYADAEENRLITFSLLGKPLSEVQVYPAIREIQRLINHVYPESIHKVARKCKVADGSAGWFTFITGGIKEDTGHFMFVLPVNESMLLGSYHASAKLISEETSLFLKILKNIKIRSNAEDRLSGYEGSGLRRQNYIGF